MTIFQPIPEKMRREMVIGIQKGILNSRITCFFLNEPFEKRHVTTI